MENEVGIWIQIQRSNMKAFFHGDGNMLYLDCGSDCTNLLWDKIDEHIQTNECRFKNGEN